MTEIIKKAVKSLGGAKNAGIMALFLALGIALTLFGGEGSGIISSESRGGEEKKIERLCERVCPDADVYVTVNTNSVGDVTGIAVVCSGGNSAGVKLTICEMLSTLYSIPSSQIYVTGFM